MEQNGKLSQRIGYGFTAGGVLLETGLMVAMAKEVKSCFTTGVLNVDTITYGVFASVAVGTLIATGIASVLEEKKTDKMEQSLLTVLKKDKCGCLTAVTSNFFKTCEARKMCYSERIKVTYSVIFEMKRAGYENDEIAEYLTFIMDELDNNPNQSNQLRKIRKLKVKWICIYIVLIFMLLLKK